MKQKVKKIIIIISSFFIIFNCMIPTSSYAGISWEGLIFDPISFLVCGIGDAITNTTQEIMLPFSQKAIRNRDDGNGKYQMTPRIFYSPASIFSNMIPSLDVNFISPSIKNPFLTDSNIKKLVTEEGYSQRQQDQAKQLKDGTLEDQGNSAAILQGIISKWYVAIRNIAIVGLLIVLIYIGIRILISATGEEQAKYKIMIKNWVMALILVAVMHFIMMFLLTAVQTIGNAISTGLNSSVYNMEEGDLLFNSVRTNAGDWTTLDPTTRMGYTLMYFVLIIYSLMFTIRYVKRVIYMAFLTIISPMVALTYPIDKVNDGKAQAFNFWFREYLFNLLIQPIHLLLYAVLVSAAAELAKTNMIYALVAIGFILQAENFIKEMFGIQGEGGLMDSNFATGMVAGTVLSKISSGASKVAGISKGMAGQTDKIRMHHSERGKDKGKEQLGDFGKRNGIKGIGTSKGKTENNKKEKKKPDIKLNNPQTGTERASTTISSAGATQNKQKLKNNPANANPKAKNSKNVLLGLDNVRRRYINSNLAKKAIKLAAMGYGAGIGAAIGVAGGLASDDYKNVLTGATAGGTAGAVAGKAMSQTAENTITGVRNAKDTIDKGFYGDEYEAKKLNPYLDKKWEKDPDVREHYQTTYGDNWKQKMEEAKEFRRQGIVDQNEIDKGIKLKDEWNKPIEEQLENGEITEEEADKQRVTSAEAANIMSLAEVNRDEMVNHRDQIREKQVLPLLKEGTEEERQEQADKVMALLDKRFGTEGMQDSEKT